MTNRLLRMSYFFQKKEGYKSPFFRLHSHIEDISIKIKILSLPAEINMTYHYNLTVYCKTLIHHPDSSPLRFQLLFKKKK